MKEGRARRGVRRREKERGRERVREREGERGRERERELRRWVTVGFGRDTMLTPPIVVGRVSVKLNNRMAVGYGLLCPIWEPTQWRPDEFHLRWILEVITYHFLSVFAYSFSYSCSRSDCTGFHTSWNHVWRGGERAKKARRGHRKKGDREGGRLVFVS